MDVVDYIKSFVSSALDRRNKRRTVGFYNPSDDSIDNLMNPLYAGDKPGAAGDIAGSLYGGGLTSAQVEANQYSSNESALAFRRSIAADSTKYQRQVADLQAAGLNPMLAVGQSAGSVQSSPASSVAPRANFNLGSLLSFASSLYELKLRKEMNVAQIKNIDADTANKEADTANKEATTTSINLANEITEATKQARIEAASLSNDLTRKNIVLIEKKLDEIDEHINLLKEQATTEESKRQLNAAQSLLARANAQQVVQLLPYQKQLLEAQSEQAKQAALLSAAHTAYQTKLIDDGYIDAFISEQKAKSGVAISKEQEAAIKAALRTGDWSNSSLSGILDPGNVLHDLMQTLTIALDNINPLNGLLGGK